MWGTYHPGHPISNPGPSPPQRSQRCPLQQLWSCSILVGVGLWGSSDSVVCKSKLHWARQKYILFMLLSHHFQLLSPKVMEELIQFSLNSTMNGAKILQSTYSPTEHFSDIHKKALTTIMIVTFKFKWSQSIQNLKAQLNQASPGWTHTSLCVCMSIGVKRG